MGKNQDDGENPQHEQKMGKLKPIDFENGSRDFQPKEFNQGKKHQYRCPQNPNQVQIPRISRQIRSKPKRVQIADAKQDKPHKQHIEY